MNVEINDIYQLTLELFFKLSRKTGTVNFQQGLIKSKGIELKGEDTFFSIKTLDPDKMPDNVLSWKHEHGILIEDGKVEYYKDGSLIFEENMTMQQVYEKFTLDHVLNLFRSIDNLF